MIGESVVWVKIKGKDCGSPKREFGRIFFTPNNVLMAEF
jgi:hypothetical protein